ncbi:Transposable element Hobo transposase [Frankliniella fusca]|uniref:Transposable element Hobo transposase n=1 Tax=Frankliniella fusca TaxID=407009 RepID=A0AAE1LNB4_9NEOP|nr:Transposable element Hobo transposase [Frankliniella fusca]
MGGQKRRSEVWDTFHVVVDNADLEYNNTSLKKHHDGYCSAELTTAGNTPFRPVPGGLRDVFVDKVADTCALTMGAVNLLTSDAVVDLLQVAVDIAARCKGRVDVRALMPCANTVLARIDSKADSATAELVPRVRAAIRDKRCQESTDMWTDDQCKQHFIAVTVTSTNEEAVGVASETHDLVTAKFPANVKATSEKIRGAMVETLKGIGIPPDEFEQIEWVTDRGANVIKALEDLPRKDCAAHVVNTVVRSSLSVPYYELRGKAMGGLSDAAPHSGGRREGGEGSTTRPKRAGCAPRSPEEVPRLGSGKLPQQYSNMLSSVCLNKPKVLAVLEALARQDLAERLRGLDQTIVDDLVDFLGPLEKNKTVVGGRGRRGLHQEEDSQEIVNIKAAVDNLRVLLEILLLIKEAKELVQYMKSTGLASLLKKRVMQEVETRWNSIHTMLFSVLESYDEIVAVLAQHGEDPADSRMQRINRDQLLWLSDFLQEFKAETKTLEGNDHPTLPCVFLASANLRDHCEPALFDCTQLTVLKDVFTSFS